ncbi:unnamed protein product [Protopolystoma xenopodis]|uniref:Uncharacterized protein n=1 Tax=Protopolystoma xenopodis TaxID=117903 RepID=A0A448XSK4_9PLAT|nr:unnamed protein product [Protopolystoma xenopodis]
MVSPIAPPLQNYLLSHFDYLDRSLSLCVLISLLVGVPTVTRWVHTTTRINPTVGTSISEDQLEFAIKCLLFVRKT